MVIEQDIAFVKPAGDTKSVDLFLHFAGVDHSRLGQGSKGHHQGFVSYGVIHDFVPVEDFYGICPRLPPHGDPDDPVTRFDEMGLIPFDESRLEYSRDTIFRRPSGEDLPLGNKGILKVEA